MNRLFIFISIVKAMMIKNKIHQITANILFAVIVCAYTVMAFKFPVAYMVGTYEDLVGEWAQVLFFFSVMVLSLRLAFYKSRYRLFFAVLALASFYTVMEEISWGQRLFNIPTPDFFQRHNLQQETNIHNFFTGPFATQLKKIMEYALFTALILYGLVYPISLRFQWRFAIRIDAMGLPAPPLYLWPFFFLSGVLELGPFSFNEAEIAEILIPLALTIFLTHHWILYHDNIAWENTNALPGSISQRLALMIVAIFMGVVLLATGITYASYTNPRLKAKIDSRIANGIEKFAGRYKRYEQWDTAVSLYHKMDDKEPGRPSIQRRLALCYKELGDRDKSQLYIDKALAINLRKIKRKPSTISAHLSQAITYRQINDPAKAEFHLHTALQNALKRIEKNPDSASAAYWLGKTYYQLEKYSAAKEQYQRAVDLRPQRSKYKKALLKLEIMLAKSGTTEEDEE